MKLRAPTPDDAAAVADIYALYVRETAITFELDAPCAEEMRARMAAVADAHPWLVAEETDGTIAGYAYACPFRPRPAYRFAVETTVYLRPEATGRGLGTSLYRPLLRTLEAQGYTQAIAAIALPNEPSVTLHERLGFVHAGTYDRVGYKLGRWLDVGLWQRALAAAGDPPAEPLPLSALGGPYLE
ncbi:GNAT family N-acetyltransferase [Bradyrhizobium sp.]|uniref:GNAT family N-acetyltransferase n=1 Tax=Bradyrhizobium sp. TaxID=376 RepID=UPI001ED38BAC|nr:GNAT family N-acetyltransferase [Bradyrhizobium sp.]MBV9984197.1 N-acetyltransferase [Bradyrhizobium sp.]